MTHEEFLKYLAEETGAQLAAVRDRSAGFDLDTLRHRPAEGQWTIAETFAHLNAIYEHYLPLLEAAIHKSKARKWTPSPTLRYSAASRRMIGRTRPEARAKALKKFNLVQQSLPQDPVKVFVINTERLLRNIQAAQTCNLDRPGIPVAGAWFGKFNTGTLLEWLVLHNRKHLLQIIARLA